MRLGRGVSVGYGEFDAQVVKILFRETLVGIGALEKGMVYPKRVLNNVF
jgi:hypothetical protein